MAARYITGWKVFAVRLKRVPRKFVFCLFAVTVICKKCCLRTNIIDRKVKRRKIYLSIAGNNPSMKYNKWKRIIQVRVYLWIFVYSINMSISLTSYLSVFLFIITLSVCQSNNLSICVYVCLSTHLSSYLPIYLLIYKVNWKYN